MTDSPRKGRLSLVTMTTPLPIVTVATGNYLHYVRALAASLEETNPGTTLFVCFADRPPREATDGNDRFRIIFADELEIPDWKRFSFQYTPFELSCALKPFALEAVLSRTKADGVIFVDSDIQVYSSLEPTASKLAGANLLITPHLTAPATADCAVVDHGLVRAGPYNLGFVAMGRSSETTAFLGWWKSKMRHECIMSFVDHLFVDQSWMTLAPGMFAGVVIERGAGYNVAYYNMSERRVTRDAAGTLLANGERLVFFHFSGFEPARPTSLSRHDRKTELDKHPVIRELLAAYLDRLDRSGRLECENWKSELEYLSNGTEIEPAWREAIRMDHPLLAGVMDPFDVSATADLVSKFRRAEAEARANRGDWLLAELRPRLAASEARVTELEQTVHRLGEQSARLQRIEDHPVFGPLMRFRRHLKKAFGSSS